MNFQPLIDAALAEDIGSGDVTTQALIPPWLKARMRFNARERVIMAGGEVAKAVLHTLDNTLQVTLSAQEGAWAEARETLLTAEGNARSLLTSERVALNLLQRAASVATLTRAYVDAVAGTGAIILDTRKTMPGLRTLDKYAVTCGGGQNHRFGLYDAAMIKDNHIALAGDIAAAIEAVRRTANVPIIVECDTLEQVKQALAAQPDRILLDNMDIPTLHKAVELAGGHVPLEASGGITLETIRAVALTGVHYISVGRITHSAPSVDIGAEIEFI